MILFLPKDIWDNKRGAPFKETPYPLKVGYHTGQDFHATPVGQIVVTAPCAGVLKTFPFSKSAGWWGYFKFNHKGEICSLKILHMYQQMRDGEYQEGDTLGYCGATGLSITKKYGASYIGESHEEQTSDRAVGHLHVELHKGEFDHETNRIKELADERIIDPISTFEKWINEESSKEIPEESIVKEKEGPIQQPIISDPWEPKAVNLEKEKSSNGSMWDRIIKAITEWLKTNK